MIIIPKIIAKKSKLHVLQFTKSIMMLQNIFFYKINNQNKIIFYLIFNLYI